MRAPPSPEPSSPPRLLASSSASPTKRLWPRGDPIGRVADAIDALVSLLPSASAEHLAPLRELEAALAARRRAIERESAGGAPTREDERRAEELAIAFPANADGNVLAAPVKGVAELRLLPSPGLSAEAAGEPRIAARYAPGLLGALPATVRSPRATAAAATAAGGSGAAAALTLGHAASAPALLLAEPADARRARSAPAPWARGRRFFRPDGDVSAGWSMIKDNDAHRVRRVCSESGAVVTVADADRAGWSAEHRARRAPTGFALDSRGRLLICDGGDRRIRFVRARHERDAVESGDDGGGPAFAGAQRASTAAEEAAAALVFDPTGVGVADGTIFLSEYSGASASVRMISPSGAVSALIGDDGGAGDASPGARDAVAPRWAGGLGLGPDGILYVSDCGQFKARALSPTRAGALDMLAPRAVLSLRVAPPVRV